MPSTNAPAVALAAALLLAGCLGGFGGTGPTTPSTAAPAGDGPQFAHEVRVENDRDSARNVTVTIVRAGELVHEGRHAVEPGAEVVAYGWEDETLAGNRTVLVRMRPDRGEPEEVTFAVDDCHGNVVGYFDEDGFGLTYSVC